MLLALWYAGPVLLLLGWRFVASRPGPFESEEWKEADHARYVDSTRGLMVDDLLARHRLEGRSREAVVDLLGAPDPDPYLLVEQPRHAGAFIYRLGPDHLGLDSMWLVVEFDGDTVRRAHVVSD